MTMLKHSKFWPMLAFTAARFHVECHTVFSHLMRTERMVSRGES